MAAIARRAACALALCAGAAEDALAQMQFILGPGAEFVGAGVSRLTTGELNDRLAARGYPTFGRTPLGVTLGGHRVLANGVMLGAEWHGIIHENQEHQGREVGLGGGYGTLSVGYAVDLSPRARAYPRLGLGAGGLGLWIEDQQPDAAFDDVLADPARYRDTLDRRDRETVLSHGSVLVDLGVGVELLSRAQGRGPMIGLRLGYVVTPSATSWRLDERGVSGGPTATLAGPYVRMVVGTARRR